MGAPNVDLLELESRTRLESVLGGEQEERPRVGDRAGDRVGIAHVGAHPMLGQCGTRSDVGDAYGGAAVREHTSQC